MSRKPLLVLLGCVCLLIGWQVPAQEAGKPAAQAPQAAAKPADTGLTAAFEEEVIKVGQITPDQFAQRFATKAKYQAKISWDPTTGKYWDRFSQDPDQIKGMGEGRLFGPRVKSLFDFRLNDRELAVFKDRGFVVSERMGSHSFTDLYYRIYVRDLPVFVSSDSMLHAWHRYFDRLLEGLEDDYFHPEIRTLLASMAVHIAAAKKEYGQGPLAEAVTDVDFFLAVARDLLQPGSGQSVLGQEQRVADAVRACNTGQMERYRLFGRVRPVDFSQFKPRGRYDEHDHTKRYFRALMWLGRIDFRIAGGDTADQDMRELAGSIVLHDLLRRSGLTERWQHIDRALLRLVGKSDSLNFSQLGVVLGDGGDFSPAKVTPAALADLRGRILASKIGEQHIRGEWFLVDSSDPRKFVLPRTFAFLGQRFILDSWVLSKIVYDDIIWDREKIERRIPSALDVAFAVFGNDHVTPLLAERMKNRDGKKFRDGLPYQHNLAAARQLVDRMPESTWQESLYADWLGCLRELSRPTTDAKYPEAMRTASWPLKATVTQLASWTQLRHDTVLYAKPSYTSGESCEYPAGYVEPVPHFWRRYEQMVQRTRTIVAGLPFPEANKHAKARHLMYLDNFVKAAGLLRAIADKELAQQELTKEETLFLKEVVVLRGECGSPPVNGWYPNLFSHRSVMASKDDAHKWVALVTDVHTDPPSPPAGDPGCVLHQAVGNVDLVVIAIDNGKDRMVYAGPVFSHYEYETPNAVRHTNGDWHNALRAGKQPPRPEWTRGFVVPGVNPHVSEYGKEDKRGRN
jgi:hypothetical protein